MVQILVANPLLLLFLVAAVGYPLGQIKVGGTGLGVAAVLFTGLAFGALDPNLRLPEIVYILGLVLFVYTVGLGSGAAFVASLRREGLRNALLVTGVLLVAAGLVVAAQRLLGLGNAMTAGLFSGSLTVTPALASALETLKHTYSGPELDRLLAEPVVGYSIAYPMGVLGMILTALLLRRVWKVDFEADAKKVQGVGLAAEPLRNCTFMVTRPEVAGETVEELSRRHDWNVIFGRIKHGESYTLATAQARLAVGDLVTAVGTTEDLERVEHYLGNRSSQEIDLDRSQFDFRRIFVSSPKVAGRTLRELDLAKFDATVTRIRRGDTDFLPHGDLPLELGDRVRVLCPRRRMDAVSRFFGDSYRRVSEIDILPFSLGLALGLLLGIVPIPLPQGAELRLGFAGGPLLVGLLLGRLGRTGPIVWSLPYSANLALRQIGLVLFLAGIGTRSGYVFFSTLSEAGGAAVFLAGAVITSVTAFLFLWVGYRLLEIPMSVLLGMLAGLQTQSALLGFALEQSGNELPNSGYASVYPMATIVKIVLVQLLLAG